ncbi:unnamed protein product [Arctogadus glacialis]
MAGRRGFNKPGRGRARSGLRSQVSVLASTEEAEEVANPRAMAMELEGAAAIVEDREGFGWNTEESEEDVQGYENLGARPKRDKKGSREARAGGPVSVPGTFGEKKGFSRPGPVKDLICYQSNSTPAIQEAYPVLTCSQTAKPGLEPLPDLDPSLCQGGQKGTLKSKRQRRLEKIQDANVTLQPDQSERYLLEDGVLYTAVPEDFSETT